MNRKVCHNLKNGGSTIVLALLAVVMLMVIGGGILSIGLQGQFTAIRTGSEIKARTAADAGLTQALFMMNRQILGKVKVISYLPLAENQPLPYSDSTFSYKIAFEDRNAKKNEFAVVSSGKSDRFQRTVYANIGLKGLFEYAVLVKDSIIMKNDTVIDGYNSSDPTDTNVDVQIGTISTEESNVILNNAVVINGDVLVGVGGDPAEVIVDHGATTDSRKMMAEEPDFPLITAPALTDMASSIQAAGITQTIGPADNGKYNGIDLEQISTKITGTTYVNPGTLVVDGGDVVLHITGDVLLGEGCEIIVKTGSSLKLYVDGIINCKTNSSIGYEGTPTEPTHIQIYSTSTEDLNWDIKAKNHFSGTIYAPTVDLDIYAKGDIYGSIVADDFEFKAGGNFHYDKTLREVDLDDEGVQFVVKSWRE